MRKIVVVFTCLLGLYYLFGGLVTSAIEYNWDAYKGFTTSGTSRIGYAAHGFWYLATGLLLAFGGVLTALGRPVASTILTLGVLSGALITLGTFRRWLDFASGGDLIEVACALPILLLLFYWLIKALRVASSKSKASASGNAPL